MEIPLKNKNGEIVGNTLVSKEDYEHLSKFKWFKNKENYVRSKIENKDWFMHRYILINILKNELTSKQPVDHINNNSLDNTRENLRISTLSENSRNRKKKENLTSQYYGVSKVKNKWVSTISINNKKLSAYYKTEIHSAHQYNLWIKEFNLNTETFNNIDEPKNFIPWVSSKKKRDLPIGITKIKNEFLVGISIDNNNKYIGRFENLKDAINARKLAEEEKNTYLINKLYNKPILYNKNKQCYFLVKNKQVIIDKEVYYDIIKYSWQITKKNYIQGNINGKSFQLHRYIMNYSGENYIDHINGNPLDNRKENLRIVTPKQNNMNMKKSLNCSSKYIGVSFEKDTNKWKSSISVNGKRINLGRFNNEMDAGKERDKATKKYYGQYGKLNFPNE